MIGTAQFNDKSVWYVRLGNPTEGFKLPSQIARKYKINLKSLMPPPGLASKKCTEGATTITQGNQFIILTVWSPSSVKYRSS